MCYAVMSLLLCCCYRRICLDLRERKEQNEWGTEKVKQTNKDPLLRAIRHSRGVLINAKGALGTHQNDNCV